MGDEQTNGEWQDLRQDYGPRLLLFARQQTQRLIDAEDVVQEAFVRYWKSPRTKPELTPLILFTMIQSESDDDDNHRIEIRAHSAADVDARWEQDGRRVWFSEGKPRTKRDLCVIKSTEGVITIRERDGDRFAIA